MGEPSAEEFEQIEQMNLECIFDATNKIGNRIMYFARYGDKKLSHFADLELLRELTGITVQDRSLRECVATESFLNEKKDSLFVERAIVYGYPLWTSINMTLHQQGGPTSCSIFRI